MNFQAQMGGQYPRQVSNQVGTSLPPQQNMMQNSEAPHAPLNMEPGFVQARQSMQKKILETLMRRQQNQVPPPNIMDIVRRLEEGLFKIARTKEEYLNLDTLDTRIHDLIKRAPMNNRNQRYQQQNNPMGTMIPTPGVPQNGNSRLMGQSSMDNSLIGGNNMMMSSTVNQGSFSINAPRLSRGMNEGFIDGSQQSLPNFPENSSGNNIISSTAGQRIGSQMMPTPGFNNNSTNINQSYMKMEPSNNISILSGADSAMVTQPMQQKQQVGGQNSRILHSLGSHMGGGIRSTLSQRPYGFPNGSLNGNLGMMGQNSHNLGNSEGFLTDNHYGNSTKPVQHYFDQHQGLMSQGDNSGNFYAPTTSTSLMNMDQLNLQRTISPMVVNKSNLHNSDMKPSIDPSENNNINTQQSLQLQPLTRQQNQQPTYGNRIKSEPNNENLQPQVYQQFQSTNTYQQQSNFPNNVDRSQGQQESTLLQGQWHSRAQEPLHQLGTNSSNELKSQIIGKNDQNLPSEQPIITAKPSVDPQSANLDRELQYFNQQKWLLFLMHAKTCNYPPGNCPESNCITAQNLVNHIKSCDNVSQCLYPRCHGSKRLIAHYKSCRDRNCPVCFRVRVYVQQNGVRLTNFQQSGNGVCATNISQMNPSVVETSEDLHPSLKRMKIEPPAQQPENPIIPVSITTTSEGVQLQDHDTCPPVRSSVKIEVAASSVKVTPKIAEVAKMNDGSGFAKQEFVKIEKEAKHDDVAVIGETSKSGKPKIKGVSMTELFTPDQVREHITGLRQWVGQSKAKVEKNQAMELSVNENSCQLCAVEKLNFEPPPIYCSPCGARIKRNAMFYTIGSGDTRHYFCIHCYNETRGDTISVDGTNILKARLEKKKNDEETEEPWVLCDKCEAWQHQICALFNGRRDDGGQAEYTCPNCYIKEVENGERVPLPQSAVLGAKDLPTSILSDHIENRLFKRLKQERLDRARFHGKTYEEVPGAESLVVRVVSSVDKKLECIKVKQRFLEIFQEENYPPEFAYKSKVVLLFQKIEGVEVCLFGMYVQEFGSESEQPNHRRVYLSYLDSVKYFRPEIRTVTGEALRTFVYHEILIGYLEYCKLRGFTSCYIWACPPLKGEDYILYCHPEIQKTPKSDKLREWYLSMLKKATKENIVVELTNLFDHFFVSAGECKAKVTASRLPYFDGDYWPGAAEDIINQIRQEEEDARKHNNSSSNSNRKGLVKRSLTKRALKASGQSQLDLSSNASKDFLLMHRLGETIAPMKEDFIMVHLQHACTHCCLLMVSGTRWVCHNCKKFQLCNRCYEIEQTLDEREKHPTNQRVKHQLYPTEIKDVPTDTKDKDEIVESEFFDTRQAFLSLCQGNHYQYDTLRRAKHSSMMALYHLHNPTAPAFVINCIVCRLDIETGQGWRCEICPDYDVCNNCYRNNRGVDHPHKLTNHPSIAERDAQNQEARQLRVVQLRKMLDLLVHASQCRASQCQYPNCRKVKGLFRHGIHCKIRAAAGCPLCKKMWHLLQLHARSCKDSPCSVPRCKDLREHLRRLTQQADSRRRAAVMEMMRQRAAEVAGTSG